MRQKYELSRVHGLITDAESLKSSIKSFASILNEKFITLDKSENLWIKLLGALVTKV